MPEKVERTSEHKEGDGGLFAAFELKPLEPGYATTVGNALRRVLLSSLEGFAVASVRIEGVAHQFDTIPGVTEDVANIILNLKQMRFKRLLEEVDQETVTLSVSDKEVLRAGDFNLNLNAFKVQNSELEICHLTKDTNLVITLRINKGRSYVPADENPLIDGEPINTIAIDSIYTPIVSVNYKSEPYRVEGKTDYDKLLLDITTDGTIAPEDALKEAARILIQHFGIFSNIVEGVAEQDLANDFDDKTLKIRQILRSELSEYIHSVRAINCLKAADVVTVADLLKNQLSDLQKIRNFGEKSRDEVLDMVKKLSKENPELKLGMDVAKYK